MEQQIAGAACKRVRDFFQQITLWRMRLSEGKSVKDLVEMVTTDIGFQTHLEADDPETAGVRAENVSSVSGATNYREQDWSVNESPAGAVAPYRSKNMRMPRERPST